MCSHCSYNKTLECVIILVVVRRTSTFPWQYIHMHQTIMIKYTTTTLNKINT